MGKAKPRHRKTRKHNKLQPTGLQSMKEIELEESEFNIPETAKDMSIDSIIEEIQSSSDEERLCGLQSLGTLTADPASVATIIDHKVVKIIGPLLVDGNSEVRNISVGILRNLSASGSVQVIERMVRDDVLTPLICLLQQYTEWNPEEASADDSDTLLQLINLLWNLCETDETALNHFMSTNVLNVLLRCLNFRTVGFDHSIAVYQFLNTVSEDNAAVLSVLRQHESVFLEVLAATSPDPKLALLKTLAAGVVVNLNPSMPWLEAVLAALSEALDTDLHPQINQLSSELPLSAPKENLIRLSPQLSNIQTLVDAQVMALEILTNLVSSRDDEMDVESEESASDEEELNGWSEGNETQLLDLSSEIHEALEKYNLAKKVYTKISWLPENVMEIITTCLQSRSLAKRVVRLQCCAFLCFNNLVSVVDVEQFGGPHVLYSLVRKVFRQQGLCLNNKQPYFECHMELIEASTSAIRAILLRLASLKFSDLGEMFPEDFEEIFKIGTVSEPRVQANVFKIVGTLGVLMVSNSLVVKTVGNYLLEAVEAQPALWLSAEALDSLMDVFAEDCTDEAAAEIDLVFRLHTLTPHLKSKIIDGTSPRGSAVDSMIIDGTFTRWKRQERRKLGEHYPVVSTVMTNLTPFIKYKGKRLAALGSH